MPIITLKKEYQIIHNRIMRCNNCGIPFPKKRIPDYCNTCNMPILKKARFNYYCSLKCKNEFDEKLLKEDVEWFDKLLTRDIKDKRKKKMIIR